MAPRLRRRFLILSAALIVGACAPSGYAADNVPPAAPGPAPATVMQEPPAAMPSTWNGCTQAQAVELAETRRAGANDPCLLHWRSIEVRQHPERAMELECDGLKAYEDPQPPGHPISLAECDRITRQDQQRMGLPPTGMNEGAKEEYRRTWGNN